MGLLPELAIGREGQWYNSLSKADELFFCSKFGQNAIFPF
jgi:hypothetical protein